MRDSAFKLLAAYANPHQVKRLGAALLPRGIKHHTRKAWGPEPARGDHRPSGDVGLWGNDAWTSKPLDADITAEAASPSEPAR